MHDMTATEVRERLKQYYFEYKGKEDPAIRSWLDACYRIVCDYMYSDLRQDELALERIADDGCPLGN